MPTYKIKMATDELYIVDTDAKLMWHVDAPDDKTTLPRSLDPNEPGFMATLVEDEGEDKEQPSN